MSRSTGVLVAGGLVLGGAVSMLFAGTAIEPTGAGLAIVLGATALLLVGATGALRDNRRWLTVVSLAILTRVPYVTLEAIHDDSPQFLANASQFVTEITQLSLPVGAVPLRYILVNAVMGGFVVLFGASGANIASLAAAIATVPVVGATATALFDSRRTGLAAGALGAVLPVHIYYSSWAYSDPMAVFVFTLALCGLIARQYGIATGATVAVFFMRAEYVLLVLLPLATLLAVRSSRLYYVVVSAPFGLTTVLTLAPDRLLSTIDFLLQSYGDILYLQYLYTTGFLSDPVGQASRNAVFYVGHLLHYGVPYWQPVLVNPLITLLFVVGVIAVVPSKRSSVIAVTLFTTVAAVGFALEQALGVTELYGLSLLLVGLGCVALLLSSGLRQRRRIQPLVATSPYFLFLLTGFQAARYILPVAIVALLYAGYGAHRLAERVDGRWRVTFTLPDGVVRR